MNLVIHYIESSNSLKMRLNFIVLVFLFSSFTTMAQEEFTMDFSWQKIERSKDSNKHDFKFELKDSLMRYISIHRGRGKKDTLSGEVVLSGDQLNKLIQHIQSLDLKKSTLAQESVDSYTAITVKSEITIGKKSHYIRVSCGDEDNPAELQMTQDIFSLLKSFIPSE